MTDLTFSLHKIPLSSAGAPGAQTRQWRQYAATFVQRQPQCLRTVQCSVDKHRLFNESMHQIHWPSCDAAAIAARVGSNHTSGMAHTKKSRNGSYENVKKMWRRPRRAPAASGLGSAASASHTQVSICMQMGSEHAMDLIGFISDTSKSAD